MNATLEWPRRSAVVLGLSVLVAGCASGPYSAPREIAQRIETATTRADHEALVSYYLNEAVAAKAIAERHRQMAKSYQTLALQRGRGSMTAHCNAVVRAQETAAAAYESMAAEHRDMAQQAKP